MDIRKIKKLAELLEESNLAEIEIHENDESVRLTRYSSPPAAAVAPPPLPAPVAAPAAPPASAPADTDDSAEEQVTDGNVIRSPMVGTFYAAPSPESENFVSMGQVIKAGDPVCIIEAMKMFNTIESDFEGKVVSILCETGQPVEFDQPLFIIR